jgi:hypothetical protein
VTALGQIVAAMGRSLRALTEPTPGNRNGRSYAVTLLTPIEPGRTAALTEVLRGFGTRECSPLAKLPDVHFARWIVIDQLRTDWPGAPEPPPRLRSAYLMFSADVTAGNGVEALPHTFFADLAERIPDEADAVWSHCRGYPGVAPSAGFVRFLAASQVDAHLYYAAHPDVTVGEIRRALRLREALAAFVLEHQDATPAALKDEYLRASESWLSSS